MTANYVMAPSIARSLRGFRLLRWRQIGGRTAVAIGAACGRRDGRPRPGQRRRRRKGKIKPGRPVLLPVRIRPPQPARLPSAATLNYEDNIIVCCASRLGAIHN